MCFWVVGVCLVKMDFPTYYQEMRPSKPDVSFKRTFILLCGVVTHQTPTVLFAFTFSPNHPALIVFGPADDVHSGYPHTRGVHVKRSRLLGMSMFFPDAKLL